MGGYKVISFSCSQCGKVYEHSRIWVKVRGGAEVYCSNRCKEEASESGSRHDRQGR